MSPGSGSRFAGVHSRLMNNLIYYYEFDEESGNRVDRSPNNLTLTDNATVGFAAGMLGNAADFESGNSEYFSRASEALLQMGDIDCAWAGWIRFETVGVRQMVLAKDDVAGREYAFEFRGAAADRLQITIWDGGVNNSVVASDFGDLLANTWYFWYSYHDAVNNEIGISINDGTVTTFTTTIAPSVTNTEFQLGARLYGGFRDFFDGRQDLTGFWKRLLLPSEVTFLYNGGLGRSYADIIR